MKLLSVLLSLIIIFNIWSCTAKKEMVETKPESVIPEIDGTFFWAIKPEINIRAENEISSKKLGKLNDGDSVQVIDNINGWYRILWSTRIQYVVN